MEEEEEEERETPSHCISSSSSISAASGTGQLSKEADSILVAAVLSSGEMSTRSDDARLALSAM